MDSKGYSKFKGYLASHNIKHKDVAHLLNITHTTFSRKINKANADFNADEIRQICNNYNLSGDLFFLD